MENEAAKMHHEITKYREKIFDQYIKYILHEVL